MKVCYHHSNFRQKFQAVLEYAFRECDKNTALPCLRSLKTKEVRDIRYSIRIGNLIVGFNSVKVSCLIHYDTLLQNATDIITKCGSYFITECNKSLLQNESVTTNCDDLIIKCDNYYKMRRLLQIATVQGIMFRRGKKMKLKYKLRTRSSQCPTFSGDDNLK